MWWRAVDGVCALLGPVCAAGALCALLGAVCAPHCVCSSRFTEFFLHHTQRDTRMFFFPLQIWLVAVTAQVTINAADTEALIQTLTGLGCWQSPTCKTKNFDCNTGVVACNANGSVTRL